MQHVILYVHDLRSSGVVRDAMFFAERIARDRPTTIVAGYGDGFFGGEATQNGYALKILSPTMGPLPRIAAAPKLRRWLRTQPPSLLMSLGNMGHATPWLACRGLDHIRRVYRISNEIARDDGVRSMLRRRWMERIVRDGERIVIVGAAMRQTPPFAHALRTGHAVEIASGIDLDRAVALATAPVPHPWLEEDVPVVLGIGRLRPQKNFDLLIAGAGIARRTRRMRLIILGGGTAEERGRLTALAAKAGLGEDFLLAGETDNVFAWLSRAAVFALPSRWEGSSLALIEALATDTPVVASRLAGDAAVVLDEGRYGRLFDGVDPAALAEALLAQISGDVVRPAGRGLSYGNSADAYAALIGEMLGERRLAA